MLQSLAGQRGSSCSSPHDEAACPTVAGGPAQIANALESEHRIQNEKWNGEQVMVAVGGPGGNPGRHRPRLVDPFLEYLSGFIFTIKHQLI